MPQKPSHRVCRSVAALSVGVLIAAGCSSGDDDASPSTSSNATSTTTISTRPPTSTTTGSVGTEAELRTAVRAFWDLYLELGARTPPFDEALVRERLAESTTGRELNQLLGTFSNNAATGVVVRGEVDVAPTIVSVDGETAEVRDCYDDRTGLYRVSDGTRVDEDDPQRHEVLMTFQREDGVWKVAAIRDEGSGCSV